MKKIKKYFRSQTHFIGWIIVFVANTALGIYSINYGNKLFGMLLLTLANLVNLLYPFVKMLTKKSDS